MSTRLRQRKADQKLDQLLMNSQHQRMMPSANIPEVKVDFSRLNNLGGQSSSVQNNFYLYHKNKQANLALTSAIDTKQTFGVSALTCSNDSKEPSILARNQNKVVYGMQEIKKSPVKQVVCLTSQQNKFGPSLRKCMTMLNANTFKPPTIKKFQQASPPKEPAQFLVAKTGSPFAAQLPETHYQATSRWNDMVQDDELERLMNCHLIRYDVSGKQTPVSSALNKIDLSKYDNMLPGYGNFGNTCFANSVIQCLVHTPALREYCRLGRHSEGCTIRQHASNLSKVNLVKPMQNYSGLGEAMKRLPLMQEIMNSKHFCAFCVLERHIQNLLTVKDSSCLPLAVIILIGKIGGGNRFHIGTQSDAQEFLYNLLEDLAKASFGYLKGVPFSYEKQTIIPKLFQGKLETNTTCSSCKQKSQKVDDFCNLNLNLVGPGGKPINSAQRVNFFDSLKMYFSVDTVEYRCEICGKKGNAKKQAKVKTMPRNLIINFIRYDLYGQKMQNNIDVPLRFTLSKEFLNDDLQKKESQGWIDGKNSQNLSNFRQQGCVSDNEEDVPRFKKHQYDLHSMIIHKGYNTSSGHYYCVCKVQTNKKKSETRWVQFNDDKITFIPDEEIEQQAQKAYLLFFRRTWDYPVIKKKISKKGALQDLFPKLQKSKTFLPSFEKDLLRFDKGLSQTSIPKQAQIRDQRSIGKKKQSPVIVDLCSQTPEIKQETESVILSDEDQKEISKIRKPGDVKSQMKQKQKQGKSKPSKDIKQGKNVLMKRLGININQSQILSGKRTRR